MTTKLKREIQENARLAYGLMYILKDDIDNLRLTANEFDQFRLQLYVRSINDALDKLITAVAEIEYALYILSSREKNTPYYERKNN